MSDRGAEARNVSLRLPAEVAAALGEDRALPETVLEAVVVELYREGRLSLSVGARALGLPLYDFIRLLDRHEVSIFDMTDEEWEAQAKVLEALERERTGRTG